jgi:hypothetical protein
MFEKKVGGFLLVAALLFLLLPLKASAYWGAPGVQTYVVPGHPDMAWDCGFGHCTLVYRDLGPVGMPLTPPPVVAYNPFVADEVIEHDTYTYVTPPVYAPPAVAVAPPPFIEPVPITPFAYTGPSFSYWPFGWF